LSLIRIRDLRECVLLLLIGILGFVLTLITGALICRESRCIAIIVLVCACSYIWCVL